MRKIRLSLLACAGLAASATAQTPPPEAGNPMPGKGPCGEIVATCEAAGFVRGDYKTGKGLEVDCIAPIMQGRTEPVSGRLPLPQVSPDLVAACKARRPRFGEGKPPTTAPPPPSP